MNTVTKRIEVAMNLAHYSQGPDCSDLVDELAALLPDGADATTNAETLVILRRIERVLHRRLNGTSIRAMADELHFEKDFDGYEATLRAAKRNAREAYVRYRSMCDALDALPVKAADADYTNLDDLDCFGGELNDLFASDFMV